MSNIRRLLYRHAIGLSTDEEREELANWAGEDPLRKDLLRRLGNPEYIADEFRRRELVSSERPCAEMKRFISAARLRRRIKVYGLAACVLLILGIGVFYFKSMRLDTDSRISESTLASLHQGALCIDSLVPGTTRAKLISEAGTAIELNASDTARLCRQILRGKDIRDRGVINHLCLDVPRGGEFKILLEDSTEVWLNSESRLRYPEAFGDRERRVSIEGEAYFKVKPDNGRPFYVETGDMTVRVYGTSFNVKAYSDEEFIITTLEKGSIAITTTGEKTGELLLSPGHQALFDKESSHVNMKVVDPVEVTGWHNGRFVLEEQPLRNIMRDLSRWYDFKYRFEDPELEDVVFMGSIPRYSNFSAAQHAIEETGDIRLRMEGDCIVISAR